MYPLAPRPTPSTSPAKPGQDRPIPPESAGNTDTETEQDRLPRSSRTVAAARRRGRRLAPSWAPYRSITGLDLRRYLQAEHGVKVPTTGHKYPVDPAAIHNALTRRDAACRVANAADDPQGQR